MDLRDGPHLGSTRSDLRSRLVCVDLCEVELGYVFIVDPISPKGNKRAELKNKTRWKGATRKR
jgi:hypothetical protein